MIKASEITDFTINKAHCDWIIEQVMELKALFGYESERMIELNNVRAMSAVDTALNSLSKLKHYLSTV